MSKYMNVGTWFVRIYYHGYRTSERDEVAQIDNNLK